MARSVAIPERIRRWPARRCPAATERRPPPLRQRSGPRWGSTVRPRGERTTTVPIAGQEMTPAENSGRRVGGSAAENRCAKAIGGTPPAGVRPLICRIGRVPRQPATDHRVQQVQDQIPAPLFLLRTAFTRVPDRRVFMWALRRLCRQQRHRSDAHPDHAAVSTRSTTRHDGPSAPAPMLNEPISSRVIR